MSSTRQEELTTRLDQVLKHPAVGELHPEARTARIHYDWMEAGEHTQRTVAHLSQQLRRFLDDKAWLENRRIMDILRGIETKALALRDAQPTVAKGEFMTIAATAADIDLPLERPLYTPKQKMAITDYLPAADEADVDAHALYAQVVLDKAPLTRHIRQMLQAHAQISLRELIERKPLTQGLAELVAYLELGTETFKTVADESTTELITWTGLDRNRLPITRRARLPRVIFVRPA